jgi:hypothetical protein
MSDSQGNGPEETSPKLVSEASTAPDSAQAAASAATGGQTARKAPEQSAGGVGRVMKKLNVVVERTILDLDACRDVVSRLITESESKGKDEVNFRSAPDSTEPVKQISQYKLAAPCSSDWNDLIGTSRCRFCSACSLNVYDCSNMDQVEVEQLVLQKENKQSFVLYKRKDGRFLTSDCPVGQKRVRSGMVTIASLAAAVVGAIAVGIWLVSNRPAEPTDSSLGPVLQTSNFSAHQTKGTALGSSKLPGLTQPSPNANVSSGTSEVNSIGGEFTSTSNMKDMLSRIKLTPTLQPLETQYGLPKPVPSIPGNSPVPTPGGSTLPATGAGSRPETKVNSRLPTPAAGDQAANQPAQSSPSTSSPGSYVQYYGTDKK